jgi:hypothetical protein
MKKTLAIAGLLLIIVAVAIALWLRGNFDGLVKDAIQSQGSAMTQATVSVGQVEIHPGDGKGVIRGLVVGNPAGFKTPHALKVGEIEIVIDIASVASDVVLIRRIAIAAPDVIYEKGDAMTNFDAIQKNIAAHLGPADDKQGGKRLIVEELTIRNIKAQASAGFMQGKTVSVPLPDIVMHDVGKARGGLTPGELGAEIARALKSRLTGAVSFDKLAKSAGEALNKAGTTIKGLFK